MNCLIVTRYDYISLERAFEQAFHKCMLTVVYNVYIKSYPLLIKKWCNFCYFLPCNIFYDQYIMCDPLWKLEIIPIWSCAMNWGIGKGGGVTCHISKEIFKACETRISKMFYRNGCYGNQARPWLVQNLNSHNLQPIPWQWYLVHRNLKIQEHTITMDVLLVI